MTLQLGKKYIESGTNNVWEIVHVMDKWTYPYVGVNQKGNTIAQFSETGNPYQDYVGWLIEEWDTFSELKIDDPVLVRTSGADAWYLRYYAGNENGRIHTWAEGKTSTDTDVKAVWSHWINPRKM